MLPRTKKIVGCWLALGCVMVFFQVIIGGVTRLTGSGLSITKWEIVTGVVPPITEAQWRIEFSRYQATPQYQQINQGMSLKEFQFIYFWEYFHRLWARIMGVVFLFPFLFFLYKKWLPRDLLIKLSVVVLWGGLIGLLGWVMVTSGLEMKPYVAPIKLALHLTPAMCLLAYMVWLMLSVFYYGQGNIYRYPVLRKMLWALFALLVTQIFLGGIVSGMKAGLAYPTWPMMNGEWLPALILQGERTLTGITDFDFRAAWGQALIQFVHRSVAYLLIGGILIFMWRAHRLSFSKTLQHGIRLFLVTVLLQATIGIITVTHCVGHIPVLWGVLHQAGAMLLLAHTVFLLFHLRATK